MGEINDVAKSIKKIKNTMRDRELSATRRDNSERDATCLVAEDDGKNADRVFSALLLSIFSNDLN